jgi:membrane protein YdbS with pleckstrin-like domain
VARFARSYSDLPADQWAWLILVRVVLVGAFAGAIAKWASDDMPWLVAAAAAALGQLLLELEWRLVTYLVYRRTKD